MSTQPPEGPPTLSLAQLLWRITKAVIIWIFANLLTFILVSFVVFILLRAVGGIGPDEAFSLAVICAIPAALLVSSIVAGRRLIYLAWKRYRD